MVATVAVKPLKEGAAPEAPMDPKLVNTIGMFVRSYMKQNAAQFKGDPGDKGDLGPSVDEQRVAQMVDEVMRRYRVNHFGGMAQVGRIDSSAVDFLQSGITPTARSVQDKLRDSVCVWDFLTAAELADVQAETRLVDVTASFQRAYNAAIGKTLYVPKGKYSIQTAGGLVATGRAKIVGDGVQSTYICRDFSPASDPIGAINLGVFSASILEDLQIFSKTGTTGGCLVSVISSASVASSFMNLRNVDLTFEAINTYKYALYIDGTAKTGAPIGARDTTLTDVQLFGGTSGSALFKGVVNLTWKGGGAFAGGSSSGSVVVTGDASVNSSGVSIDICSGAVTTDSFVANADIEADAGLRLHPSIPEQAFRIGGTGTAHCFAGYSKDASVTLLPFVGASMDGFAVPNGQTFTFTPTGGSTMFVIHDSGAGKAGVFFATNASATITIISDPSSYFENSATPTAGKFGVFKSAASNTISVINSVGSQRTVRPQAFSPISTTTDPA